MKKIPWIFGFLLCLLCVSIGAEELQPPNVPWSELRDYCSAPNKEQTGGQQLVVCDGNYFFSQVWDSVRFYQQALALANDLDTEKKKALVNTIDTSTHVWRWVGVGVAILVAGTSGYLVGRYVK